jgi:tripartite-type tricarboxylate transporter receptor subunit TctC
MNEAWGQPVVIENRPGANGNIGTEYAAHATADGHTVLMTTAGPHGINPSLYRRLGYDAVKDFAPITLVAQVPYVLVVDPALPAKSVAELIALVRSRPGKMNYASAGNGSTHQFCAELLKSTAGIDVVHIPYKGSPPGVAAVLAGEVSLMFANLTDVGSQLRAGKLRPLAVTTAKRSAVLPDVPTIAEAGVKGGESALWVAMWGPAGMSPEVVNKINADTRKALADPAVKARLQSLGNDTMDMSPQEFSKLVRTEMQDYARVLKAAGIKPQ